MRLLEEYRVASRLRGEFLSILSDGRTIFSKVYPDTLIGFLPYGIRLQMFIQPDGEVFKVNQDNHGCWQFTRVLRPDRIGKSVRSPGHFSEESGS